MKTFDENQTFQILEPVRVKYVITRMSEVLGANHKLMGVDKIWTRTKGAGVKVAVLDTGVPNHKDLRVAGGKSFIKGYYEDKNGHGCVEGNTLVQTSEHGICKIRDLYNNTDAAIQDVVFPDGVVSHEKDISDRGIYTLCLGFDGLPKRVKITKLHKVRVSGNVVRVSASGLPDMRLTPWHEVPVVNICNPKIPMARRGWHKVRADQLTVNDRLYPCCPGVDYFDGSDVIKGQETWRCTVCDHEFDAVSPRNYHHIGCKKCGHYNQWERDQREFRMTPELAWLIGYITADGHITHSNGRRRVEATSKDAVILETCMQRSKSAGFSSGRIEHNIDNKIGSSGHRICDRWLCFDKNLTVIFEKEGLADRKTYNARVASCVARGSREVVCAYLAGVLDGDGCVDPDGRRVRITTVCKRWADELCVLLRSIGVIASLRYCKNYSFGSGVENKNFPVINVTFGHVPDDVVKHMVHPVRKQRALVRDNFDRVPRCMPIRSVSTEFCDEYFYDMTVEDDSHTYFANGVFVSNTHVGGVLSAIEGNGIGIAGIAPEADVYYGAVMGEDGSGSIKNISDGIKWAVDEVGADVINMSLGIADTPFEFKSLRQACDYAAKHGVSIFAAAGNEAGNVGQPARYESTISVGAVSKNLRHPKFSNTGATVDFVSVGVDVYSTWLNNSYCCLDGTSMACPAVAGFGALLIADSRLSGENLKFPELKEKLAAMSKDLGAPGKDFVFGFGVPNAELHA